MQRFRIVLILAFLGLLFPLRAQELNATVEINTQKYSGTNTSVFENLKKTMTEFLNGQRWTELKIKQSERIKCSFNLILNKYDETTGLFECDCYIQASRPVFNAAYTTNTWTQHDNNFSFSFKEFDQLNFNEQQIDNPLTALLAYYSFLIIGIDMDTMSPLGGTDVLQRAMTLANNAQSLSVKGWKAFDDSNNRFGIINDYVAEAMKPFRQMQYDYHRKGLDQMAENAETGRKAIIESLKLLKQAATDKPLSQLPKLFSEYKRDELVGIFKGQGTSSEKQSTYDILVSVNASQLSYWKQLLN